MNPTPAPARAGSLRPARWWHLQQVVALEREIFGATAWSLEQFYAELAAGGRWFQVVEDDGRVFGYVDVAVQGRDADLMTIAVAPAVRGQGWGGALLDAAMSAARASGAHHMFLEVAENNPARALYAGRGFTTIDRRPRYYDDGAAAWTMRAALHDEPVSARE